MTQESAAPSWDDGGAGSGPSLHEILAAAPLGLELRAPDGTVRRLSGPAPEEADLSQSSDTGTPRYRREHLSVPIGGEDYELSFHVDRRIDADREEELIRRVYFDELTGLPKRVLMEESVATLIRSDPGPFALAFLDLDGFKNINDYYGHNVGDQLLTALSRRIQGMLRPTDVLGRLSGDEFLLLLTPVSGRDELALDLDWLSERLKEPLIVDGFEIFPSASIGVCTYPDDGMTYDQLRTNADRAMYASKATAKGTVCFYNPSIEHAAAERNRQEQRLRLMIRDRRVTCAYQPKVNFRTGAITGVEVLMRWYDEDGAMHGPGDFLMLAAELGLLDAITHHILERTIASIDQINEAFGRDSSISINVAACQAGDFEFMQGLVNALEASGFADRFMLELTEEAFLPSTSFQAHILPLIRSVGARVSIDDFGVGYSSLSSLAAITADEVKVDRSFITNVHSRPRSQSILRAIEALATSLGMNIIVEGVEKIEELAYLKAETGIDCAQGFCFSRPLFLSDPDIPGQECQTRLSAPTRGSEPLPRAISSAR
ncbi:putative bifunctional diguanylate cyclase/phosphodiesterase [Amaricoccus macauensis]|uniref:putative bifunctional diguanylate cyclase/phosphodiesterase n=1 Tax=Amaricoccus macauensis TaxID=57001 RepID=UPI003C7B9A69